MENFIKITREYKGISFRYTKGNIDVFQTKQFHPFYELYFLLSGRPEFISDRTRRQIEPYTLAIINPAEYHHLNVKNQPLAEYERCILNLDTDFLGGEILRGALDGKGIITLDSSHRIAQNFIYLKETMLKNSEEDFGYILTAIATDIVFLIKQSSAFEKSTHSFLHPISLDIMNYINKNYKTKIALRDISEHFFLSPSSISHMFKDDFGISIKKYLNDKRMNEIKLRLQNGQKPQEVANEFGFSNYSTFYRGYMNHFGTAPSVASKINKKS